MIPYSDGQSIHFITSSGDRLQTIVKLIPEITGERISYGIKYKIETLSYKLLLTDQPLVEGSIGDLNMVFNTIMSPVHNYQVGFGFDLHTETAAPRYLCNVGRQTCVGTVTLGGTMFSDVVLAQNSSIGTGSDYIAKAWFTADKGLIGFAYGSGITYVRL